MRKRERPTLYNLPLVRIIVGSSLSRALKPISTAIVFSPHRFGTGARQSPVAGGPRSCNCCTRGEKEKRRYEKTITRKIAVRRREASSTEYLSEVSAKTGYGILEEKKDGKKKSECVRKECKYS